MISVVIIRGFVISNPNSIPKLIPKFHCLRQARENQWRFPVPAAAAESASAAGSGAQRDADDPWANWASKLEYKYHCLEILNKNMCHVWPFQCSAILYRFRFLRSEMFIFYFSLRKAPGRVDWNAAAEAAAGGDEDDADDLEAEIRAAEEASERRDPPPDTGGWAGGKRVPRWADATSSSSGGDYEEDLGEAEEQQQRQPNTETRWEFWKPPDQQHHWEWWSPDGGSWQPDHWQSADDWWSAGGSGGTGGWTEPGSANSGTHASSSTDQWQSAAGSGKTQWYRPEHRQDRCSECGERWAPVACKFNACLACCPKSKDGIICARHSF